MALHTLLDQFQEFILTGRDEIEASIVSTALVSAKTRLNIYRDAYRLRLIESLTSSFPGLHEYLGTDAFEQLCTTFIEKNVSNYRSIRWYGDKMAEFVLHYFPQDYAYLSELTDFEWVMSLVFDAQDTELVTVEDMTTIAPEAWAGLQFIPHPSIKRLNHFYNAIPLWQAVTNDQPIPEIVQSKNATPWILWRAPDFQLKYHSLSAEEAWALDVMMQGLSFGELCEGLCNWVDESEVGLKAATYLKGWIQNGMLTRLLLN